MAPTRLAPLPKGELDFGSMWCRKRGWDLDTMLQQGQGAIGSAAGSVPRAVGRCLAEYRSEREQGFRRSVCSVVLITELNVTVSRQSCLCS